MKPNDTPLVLRFLAKFVLDIMPAALASVIGGFLFSHYHWATHGAGAGAGWRAACRGFRRDDRSWSATSMR